MHLKLLGAAGAACLLFLAACGGAVKAPVSGKPADPGAPPASSAQLELALNAVPSDSLWRVTLSAPTARDLYQIAGSISYDTSRYEIVRTEAGGGLGSPEDALYISGEPQPGKLDFAYTRRMAGPGVDGPTNLYSIIVRPLDAAGSLSPGEIASDFELDLADSRLVARNSRKQNLRCSLKVVQR